MFQWYVLPPSSGLLRKTSIQQEAGGKQCVLAGLLFDLEDGGSTFLKNINELLPDYLVSRHRR
jgi:hypothetical protein